MATEEEKEAILRDYKRSLGYASVRVRHAGKTKEQISEEMRKKAKLRWQKKEGI